ncbi:hypothetical protein R1sor_006450 [Riccia sorocarpa]|uniref:Bromo domain-containing protein n=1 Tax=Riccia sorocarpa TaxID=122646 RepID=A0ABD3HQP2_9MARC
MVAHQAAAPNSSASAFAAPTTRQFSALQVHRKNAPGSSHNHAVTSSSAPQGHIVSDAPSRSAATVSGSVATSTLGPASGSNVSNHQLTPPKKRKFKKQASLQAKADLNGVGVAQGNDTATVNTHQAQFPAQPISRPLLDGVLDKLQKKDTYGVFVEPVDAEQVPDYYDVLKEPMDFGTMRKKVNKGSYTTVETFERYRAGYFGYQVGKHQRVGNAKRLMKEAVVMPIKYPQAMCEELLPKVENPDLPYDDMIELTEAYSGSDLRIVCKRSSYAAAEETNSGTGADGAQRWSTYRRRSDQIISVFRKAQKQFSFLAYLTYQKRAITKEDVRIALETTRPSAHLLAARQALENRSVISQFGEGTWPVLSVSDIEN